MQRTTVSLLLVGSVCLSIPAHAAFTLLDDFEGHTLGTNVSSAGGWSEFGTAGGTIVVDPGAGASQVAQLTGAANNEGYQLGLGANTIADGSEATIFFRYRTTGALSVYLTDQDTITTSNWYSEDEFGLYNRDIAGPSDLRGHYNTAVQTSVNQDEWYNVWIHALNTATPSEPFVSGTSERYFIYVNGVMLTPGDGNGDNSYDTRSWNGNVPDLDVLYFVSNDAAGGGLIDDLYIDNTGLNLSNPIPEPASAILLVLSSLGLLVRRRR